MGVGTKERLRPKGSDTLRTPRAGLSSSVDIQYRIRRKRSVKARDAKDKKNTRANEALRAEIAIQSHSACQERTSNKAKINSESKE